jgi:hypothetical protein
MFDDVILQLRGGAVPMLAIVGMFADFADVDGKKTQHGQFLKLSDHFHWPDERADQKLLETVDESVQGIWVNEHSQGPSRSRG